MSDGSGSGPTLDSANELATKHDGGMWSSQRSGTRSACLHREKTMGAWSYHHRQVCPRCTRVENACTDTEREEPR